MSAEQVQELEEVRVICAAPFISLLNVDFQTVKMPRMHRHARHQTTGAPPVQGRDESWAQRLPLVSLPNARGSGNRAALELHKVRL